MNGRLKEIRLKNRMSQEEFGSRIGIESRAHISALENGNRNITDRIVNDICREFGINEKWLRTGNGEMSVPAEDKLSAYIAQIANGDDDFIKDIIEVYMELDQASRDALKILAARISEKRNEKGRMAGLEHEPTAVIDIHPRQKDGTRFIGYYRSASAGTGVFILGNEAVDQLPIPDTPENRKVDYAIKVSGDSMEPDYCDGDIVLVSQKLELNHGDVGIFILNSDAFIKEYGETELISRNPDSPNVTISEHDNIVCMGKVVGKYGA